MEGYRENVEENDEICLYGTSLDDKEILVSTRPFQDKSQKESKGPEAKP